LLFSANPTIDQPYHGENKLKCQTNDDAVRFELDHHA